MKTEKLYSSYAIGFGLSIILTIGAFHIAVNHLFSTSTITITILTLAVIQLLVQIYFFLHISSEPKPRWNLIALLNAIVIILIIVVSSIWIMNHLNYNMTPNQMEQKIMQDELIHK